VYTVAVNETQSHSTCYMGSHGITCQPTQVKSEHTPALAPTRQAGTRYTYSRGMEG